MKVVPVNIVDNSVKNDTNRSSMPKLNKGETILAQVVEKNGDIITMQRPDRTRMVARAMSDTLLTLGDSISLTVGDNIGNQLMMQLVSVEAGTVEIGGQNLQDGGGVTLQTQVGLIFENMGLKPNAEMTRNVMNMLQQNEGLSPRVAVFMALNGIEPSPENINTINSMVESPIGSKLSEMANQLLSQNESLDSNIKLVDMATKMQQQMPNNVSQQQASAKTNNAQATQVNTETVVGTQNNPEQAQMTQGLQNNNQGANQTTQEVTNNQGVTQTVQEAQTNQNQQGQVVDSTSQSQPSMEGSVEGNVLGEAINQQEQSQTPIKTDMFSKEFIDLLSLNKSNSDESQILAKVLSLFTELGSDGKDGKRVSESKEGSESKLNELKDMIQNSDIKGKEVYLSKSDTILAEKAFESDINRFGYMQIPIGNKENTQTAEVFVYRRKKRGKALDAQNVSILVGLDTMNLGRIETLIKVDKNNISLKISEENSNAANLIKRHAQNLNEELKEIGFNLLNIKVEKLYEKTTIVNAEETLMRSETNETRGRVDYKV